MAKIMAKVETLPLNKKQLTKGQKTKERILFSAIAVLAKNGIKGTTHRAIATQADIQLSLTTYYFKDIDELIQQAFELNSSYLRKRTSTILDKAFSYLEEIKESDLHKTSVKHKLCDQLVNMTTQYLLENIKKEAMFLSVEQLMFTTVQVSPQLKKLAYEHEQSQLKPFELLCCHFNNVDPDIDAQMMRNIFSQLQYSQLLLPKDEISAEYIEKTTRKITMWIMKLNVS